MNRGDGHLATAIYINYRDSIGLGMEAQRTAVARYSEALGLPIIASYAEVETGRKSDLRNRPQLLAAVGHARRSRALLVIARLDRLARNVYVTSQLMESGVEFVACDVPFANRLTIQILAAMAEHESAMISTRVKAAFDVMRSRGVSFKRPGQRVPAHTQKAGTIASAQFTIERTNLVYRDLLPTIADLRAGGASLFTTAQRLNEMGHRNQRGTPWTRGTVYALLQRENMSVQPPTKWIGASVARNRQAAATVRRHEIVIIKTMKLRAENKTMAQIAELLNKSGLRTPRGLPWNNGSLSNLLQRQGAIRRFEDATHRRRC